MKRLALLVILLGFPMLEALLIVRLGENHMWYMVAWLLLAACAGVALIKEARFALVARLAAALSEGRFSITALVDSARTVVAGLLLIFPGVVSDLIAFTLLLLPVPRGAVEPAPARSGPARIIEGEFRRAR